MAVTFLLDYGHDKACGIDDVVDIHSGRSCTALSAMKIPIKLNVVQLLLEDNSRLASM